MSGPTKIEWADSSWNPVTGCSKVSAGCAHCWAERQATRFAGRGGYPKENPFAVTRHPERLADPLHWRKPRRVFVNSMSDLFHPDVSVNFIDQVFAVMLLAPQHTFLVLTKRPERMATYTNQRVVGQAEGFTYGDSIRLRAVEMLRGLHERFANEVARRSGPLGRAPWPLANVWLGTSIEDQPTANERVIHVLRCQAARRFVSYEPALGLVDFTRIDYTKRLVEELTAFVRGRGRDPDKEIVGYGPGTAWINALSGEWCDGEDYGKEKERLDWVIAGGESGPKARPCYLEWIKSVVEQCRGAGVSVFVKQLGRFPSSNQPEGTFWEPLWGDKACTKLSGRYAPCGGLAHKGGNPADWPEDLRVQEYPNA